MMRLDVKKTLLIAALSAFALFLTLGPLSAQAWSASLTIPKQGYAPGE